MSALDYTAQENAQIRDMIFSGESWAAIAGAFPARAPYGIRRHAFEMGFVTSIKGCWPHVADDEEVLPVGDTERLLEVLQAHHAYDAGELTMAKSHRARLAAEGGGA